MKNFKVIQKVNFATENVEKQVQVTMLCDKITSYMLGLGYSESLSTDKKIDYVFSVGGDGTMLHSMNQNVNKNSVVIGINAGNVGFLTPYNINDVLDESIFKFLNGQAIPRIEKRSIMKHTFTQNGKVKRGVAVNDYSFKAYGSNDMMEFSLEIENNGIISRAGHYRADGFVLSGPCGSTAYNMNAGGAIVDPSMRCMQMIMIAPTTLGVRPLVFGKNTIIHIRFKNKAKIFMDGMPHAELEGGKDEVMSVSLMKKESLVLVPEDWNFYSVLSTKLHWNNGREV